MPSNELTPAEALGQAAALVRQRAARLGAAPAPAPKVTVVLDEAATLPGGASGPAQVLVGEILHRGRAAGIREPEQTKPGLPGCQCAAPARLLFLDTTEALLAGTTGSGKTSTANLLAAMERGAR